MAYKKIILDESLLDIDSWLPEEAFRELAQVVLEVNNDMFLECLNLNKPETASYNTSPVFFAYATKKTTLDCVDVSGYYSSQNIFLTGYDEYKNERSAA